LPLRKDNGGGVSAKKGDAMKAIVQDVYGESNVLQLKEIDKPSIGEGEVLIQVRAAGVDPGVWHLMAGVPYLVRLVTGLTKPKDPVRGFDVAGIVESVGARVTKFKVGDEVFGACQGAFAEYAVASPDKLSHKPSRLTFAQAAAIPISAGTALDALVKAGRLTPGQRVLLIGAAGGVGSFAVQLAKALDAEVTGVCSTSKMELVRSLGADHVIDYTKEDFADGERRYDLILDMAGNREISHLRRALTPRGTLVIVGGEGEGRWTGMGRQLRAMLLSMFVGQRLCTLISLVSSESLARLQTFIDSGKLTPVIDRTYPLHRAAEAVDYIAKSQARGKVVLTIE
jgi:NADPH:quinone reductase-like Zn-dependent oxidoreductase